MTAKKMYLRTAKALGAVAALGLSAVGLSSTAVADVQMAGVEQRTTGATASVRGATTKASVREIVEGGRYVVTTTVKSPKQASTVTVQKFDPPDYSFQEPEWVDVRTLAVRGRAKLKTRVIATDPNTERYRAVVSYRKGRAVTTKPATVTIWRWIPLSEYDPYY